MACGGDSAHATGAKLLGSVCAGGCQHVDALNNIDQDWFMLFICILLAFGMVWFTEGRK